MNGCIMQTQHELPNVYLSTEQGELHCCDKKEWNYHQG